MVATAKAALVGSTVKVASVATSFPAGQSPLSVKRLSVGIDSVNELSRRQGEDQKMLMQLHRRDQNENSRNRDAEAIQNGIERKTSRRAPWRGIVG